MQPTSPTRKPRASSQARIAAILDAARDLLADEGIGGLSIYSVAERAEMPPSSVYHFFPSVPALLQGLTGEVHAAFRACLEQPVDHAGLRCWRDLSRIVEERMLAVYARDAAARQLILASHGLAEVTRPIASMTCNSARPCAPCSSGISCCHRCRPISRSSAWPWS